MSLATAGQKTAFDWASRVLPQKIECPGRLPSAADVAQLALHIAPRLLATHAPALARAFDDDAAPAAKGVALDAVFAELAAAHPAVRYARVSGATVASATDARASAAVVEALFRVAAGGSSGAGATPAPLPKTYNARAERARLAAAASERAAKAAPGARSSGESAAAAAPPAAPATARLAGGKRPRGGEGASSGGAAAADSASVVAPAAALPAALGAGSLLFEKDAFRVCGACAAEDEKGRRVVAEGRALLRACRLRLAQLEALGVDDATVCGVLERMLVGGPPQAPTAALFGAAVGPELSA